MIQMKMEFKELYHKYIPKTQLSEITDSNGIVLGMQWDFKKIIEFIFSIPSIRNRIENPEKLVPIIRGDAFPCGGKQCLLISTTLANFGPLCNLKLFNFISNWAYISDKDSEMVKLIWSTNLEILNEIQLIQEIFLESEDLTIRCSCKYSGDEAWFRMMNGLNASSSNFCCTKCYHIRDLMEDKIVIERITTIGETLNMCIKNGKSGHKRLPLIDSVSPIYDQGLCVTHGIMSFSKMIIKYIYSSCINMLNGDPKIQLKVNAFFECFIGKNRIDISKSPAKGSFSIKACHGIVVMKHYRILAEVCKVEHTIFPVRDVYLMFLLLYTKDYNQDDEEWIWFEQNVTHICFTFESYFCGGRQKNYPHQFARHVVPFLKENGSVRWFSNFIQETINGDFKQIFLNRTSRKNYLQEGHQWDQMSLFTAIDGDETGEKLEFVMQLQRMVDECGNSFD